MNNALVPVKTGPNGGIQRDDEVILQNQDYDRHIDTIYRVQDDKKKNTYALKMIGDMKNSQSPSKKMIQGGAPHNQGQSMKSGVFLASKQMIFGDNKKLVPSEPQPYNNNRDSQMSQKYGSYHNSLLQSNQDGPTLQNQLVKQYQQQHKGIRDLPMDNYPIPQPNINPYSSQSEEKINVLADHITNATGSGWHDSNQQHVPENEEEILRFLDSAVLEEQPTEVLVQLAQKLKERRAKLYSDNSNQQTSG